MNALNELNRLLELFPGDRDRLFDHVEHVPAAQTPEPYQSMLVHHDHMTVTMERYHGGPVDVRVLTDAIDGLIYTRKIVLLRRRDQLPVQFGLVRFDLAHVSQAVRDEILAKRTPLGRVLIEHDVLRQVDLGAIVRVHAGPELAEALAIPRGTETYGRLATIFCDQRPAIDLLEVTSPLP